MNYFELHLGDYEAATAHLSMLEDAAYGRMLRIYYRTEKALPAEVAKIFRLVRATSKPERDAVQQVLDEFFRLEDDGWHQVRADAEISAFQAGEPEREAKKANEETRLKRHREERAALFMRLTDAGHHAPWNIGTKELRGLVAALQKADPDTKPATKPETPATEPATAPATPATATQTPDTIPHSPDTIPQKLKDKDASPDGEDAAGAASPPPADPPPPSPTPAPPAPPPPAPAPPPKTAEELTRTELWRAGKSLLRDQDMPEAQCGTFVGKLVKDYGEAIVVEAVRSAVVQRPADAATWLVGACKAAKGRSGGAGKPGQLTGDQQVAASLAKAQRVAAAMAPLNGAPRPAAPTTELIDG